MIERDGWLPISLEPRQSTASSFIYNALFAPAAPVVVVVVERFSLLSLLLAQLAAPVVCGVMAALY